MQQISPISSVPYPSQVGSLQTSNNAPLEASKSSNSELTDKLEQIALLYAIASTEKSQSNDSWLLKQILLDILFGNDPQWGGISADEQAQMINEIISSGQSGSISQAMGKHGLGINYVQGGTPVAMVPQGSMISVSV